MERAKGAFDRWFDAVDGRAVGLLMEVCYAASNNTTGVVKVPVYLRVVRARILKYLYNAVYYNVNYKDLALTNVEHMTNFFMYPIHSDLKDATPSVYPFYDAMFSNTSTVNKGYLTHCFSAVIDAGLNQHPFVTRRDFDIILMYMVFTGKIRLTKTLCRSYLFKGSYNPLTDVFKCFLMVNKMNNSVPPIARAAVPRWVPVGCEGHVTMHAPIGTLTKHALKIGLAFCSENVLYWTPQKISAIVEFAAHTDVRVITKKVPSHTLFTETNGIYLTNARQGLVVNSRDCHPYVYVWDVSGLHRFDNLSEYLYSELGTVVKSTVRLVVNK